MFFIMEVKRTTVDDDLNNDLISYSHVLTNGLFIILLRATNVSLNVRNHILSLKYSSLLDLI